MLKERDNHDFLGALTGPEKETSMKHFDPFVSTRRVSALLAATLLLGVSVAAAPPVRTAPPAKHKSRILQMPPQGTGLSPFLAKPAPPRFGGGDPIPPCAMVFGLKNGRGTDGSGKILPQFGPAQNYSVFQKPVFQKYVFTTPARKAP